MKLLKNLETNLKKNKKYLLACSFGPDSMALFHYLVINKFDFEIVHVVLVLIDET